MLWSVGVGVGACIFFALLDMLMPSAVTVSMYFRFLFFVGTGYAGVCPSHCWVVGAFGFLV